MVVRHCRQALFCVLLPVAGGCPRDGAAPAGQLADCSTVPAPAAAGPVPAGAIRVQVVRLAGGCGSTLVSSGVPLAPGRLAATQLGQLRLVVAGSEQAVYVEPLARPRADGSLRAVLVQFNHTTVAGAPIEGYLVLGQPRTTTDLPRPRTDRGSPQAVVLPSDADYLVSTGLVGPTVTAASSAAGSAPDSITARYEADFRTYAEQHWRAAGATWTENYYDRAMIYYAWWMRTGESVYWQRATALALAYREYLKGIDYKVPAHWAQVEGLELHYLLTGDEASRTAVGRIADVFNLPYYMDNLSDVGAEMDNRIQARTIMALLTAWKLRAPSRQRVDWGARLPLALTRTLASQDPSGAYRFTRTSNQCGYNKPFMVGLLNDALIKYYTHYNADERIPAAVQKSVDYMWRYDWNPTARAFTYLDGPCPGHDERQVPAPDLNNMIVAGFGWVYQRTGNVAYRERAEQIFSGGVTQAWLAGSKQFNENYSSSYQYLAWRQALRR